MLKYIYVGNVRIPSYGMMIVIGVVFCNLIAQHILRKDSKLYKEFLIIEAVGGAGAIFGAKILSLLKNIMNGQKDVFSIETFKSAGYSYYGGLAGCLIVTYLLCKLTKYDGQQLSKKIIFLIPLLHSFWKIGCFMGGCCYGVPYNGPFSICYPEGINKLSGISVFPAPLLEAVIALVIAIVLLILNKQQCSYEPIGTYLILYSVSRFFLEFTRYHENKSYLSDSQLYSIIFTVIGLIIIIRNHRRSKDYE